MIVKEATLNSAQFLFEIRNEEMVRSMSLSQNEISFEEHESWLKSALLSYDTKIFIAHSEVNDEKIGYVRGKRISEELWELSWAVHSEYRGKGLSHRLLREGLKKFKGSIIARIKVNNEPSRIIARRNNFERIGNIADLELWIKFGENTKFPIVFDDLKIERGELGLTLIAPNFTCSNEIQNKKTVATVIKIK